MKFLPKFHKLNIMLVKSVILIVRLMNYYTNLLYFFRLCKQIDHVPVVAKGIHSKAEFTSFPSKISDIQALLAMLRDNRCNNMKLLQKTRDEIKSSFKTIKKRLNQLVDKLEAQSLVELEKLMSSLNREIQSDTDICSHFVDKIKNLLDSMKKAGKESETFAFECFKKCQEETRNATQLLATLQVNDYKIKFIPNPEIEKYLSGLETFGNYCVTPRSPTASDAGKRPDQPKVSPDHVYAVEKGQTYKVRTTGDHDSCTVTGICQLLDGKIAITDWQNNKVKLLDSFNYSVIAQLSMPPHPCDICPITESQLAVALYDMTDSGVFIRNEIHFLNAANGDLILERIIRLNHGCAGINYVAGKLFVSFRDAVYTYNLSGQKLSKIYEDKSGDAFVFRFCLNEDGSRIYVTNMQKHQFLTLDASGQQLSTLQDPYLVFPTGVCMADNGTVFECGFQSNNIIQIDREGTRKITTVATLSNGIHDPKALYYNKQKQELIVGLHDDNLLVLKLK